MNFHISGTDIGGYLAIFISFLSVMGVPLFRLWRMYKQVSKESAATTNTAAGMRQRIEELESIIAQNDSVRRHFEMLLNKSEQLFQEEIKKLRDELTAAQDENHRLQTENFEIKSVLASQAVEITRLQNEVQVLQQEKSLRGLSL